MCGLDNQITAHICYLHEFNSAGDIVTLLTYIPALDAAPYYMKESLKGHNEQL